MKQIKKYQLILLAIIVFGSCAKTIDNTGNCTDGVKNQGEQGIDCGGPCPGACPSCADGLMNQGETAVDCGGPCDPCYPSLHASLNNNPWISNSRNAQLMAPDKIRLYGTGQLQSITLIYQGPFISGISNAGNGFTGEYRDEMGNLYSSLSAGSIHFTTFDTVQRKVAGTFNFIATDTITNQSKLVSGGVFTELAY